MNIATIVYVLVATTIIVGFSIFSTYRIKKATLYSSLDYKKFTEILTELIDEEMTTYRLFNLEYQENVYITEDIQRNMITNVTASVYQRVIESDLLSTNLSLMYNIRDKERFMRIIASKVSIYVIAYTKEKNKDINE